MLELAGLLGPKGLAPAPLFCPLRLGVPLIVLDIVSDARQMLFVRS